MASFNKVILMGNLTRAPDFKHTPGGTAVAQLGLAVKRVWFDKQSNQKKEETTFVDVTLWGRQAEIAVDYLKKGSPVHIEGRLQLDQWDDKQTGEKRSKLKVVAEAMQLVGGTKAGDDRREQPREGGLGGEPGGSSRGPSRSAAPTGATRAGGRSAQRGRSSNPEPAGAFYPGATPDDDVSF